ncbi:polysaccharide biosynthesis tyrosine autokinase [Yinghuangia sp. KLBMP8922]|uniref:Polysaccharide biosynthesis tyrosine autokinase n=1 Tax=Yinghuangia soli TaxID=2908204 RepID=A0AA41Q2L4_9ACTN|nr:polysaccharide biosynthesis tyrosine autokinase [Yinghuangia soli]
MALLALGGLAAGLTLTACSTAQYKSVSQIFVATRGTSDVAEMNQGSAFSQARVQSYADIIASPRVTAPVVKQLGLDTSARALADRVQATARLNTVLIDITVTDTDPERAALIANAVAAEAGLLIVDLETPPGQGAAPVHIGITRSGVPATDPVSPKPLLNAGAGLLGGLLTGIAFALLRHTLDTTLRTGEEIGETAGIAVLGSVPFDKAAVAAPLAIGDQALSARAEAFRLVRTNLQFAQVDHRPHVIIVTSSLPGEGKTNTAANLALSLAQAGHTTCLIDADLRNPCVAKTFGLVQSAGLTSVLIGAATVSDVLQWAGDDTLAVLTSGPIPPNPAEILASQRMSQVLRDVATAFDVVIVDTAPLLPVADTLGLAPLTDAAILVVRAGKTPADQVRAAADGLRAVGAHILGGVLSMTDPQQQRTYGYGYGFEHVDAAKRAADATAPRPRPVRSEADAGAMGTGVGA